MNQIDIECSCPCNTRINKLEHKIALLLNVIERSKDLKEILKDLEQQQQQILTQHIQQTNINPKNNEQHQSIIQQPKDNSTNKTPLHSGPINVNTEIKQTKEEKRQTNKQVDVQPQIKQKLSIQTSQVSEKQTETSQEPFQPVYLPEEFINQNEFVTPVQINTDLTDQKPVFLSSELVQKLKPHQIDGVKFLCKYILHNLGCVLADSCGLGKTFQVLAFLHCLLKEKLAKTILIVVPAAVLRNWGKEYHFWLSFDKERPPIFSFEPNLFKTDEERNGLLLHWHKNGGLLIMSYAMYRKLCYTKKDDNSVTYVQSHLYETISQCLVDPGPDVVILDEGHQIRDLSTEITRTLKNIKTQRRIVLTGCPLQNNLLEYWCMVDFARTGFLGSYEYFWKVFADPISRGGFLDSTKYEKQRSVWRVWVLYDMLSKNVILRRDSSLLADVLPAKQEYVISVKLSEVQQKLYQSFVNYYKNRRNMFWWFEVIILLCNHPDILCNYIKTKKEQLKKALKIIDQKEKEEAQKDNFIEDDIFDFDILSPGTARECNLDRQIATPDQSGNANEINISRLSWIDAPLQELNYRPDVIENSGKMLVLLEIIQASVLVGDKVIVFSQSLFTLNYIQYTLEDYNKLMQSRGFHSQQYHYLRFDGNTNLEDRESKISLFNKKDSQYKVFLISTKAGGEGLNLTGGNRVVLFDNCWNPSRDIEASLRVYRYGQQKPVYIYRLLVSGSMETKIYYRNILKESLSRKVIDQQPAIRMISKNEIKDLFAIPEINNEPPQIENQFGDKILDHIVKKRESWINKIHFHDSMFLVDETQKLSNEEQLLAWENYLMEKKAADEYVNSAPARSITYSQVSKVGACKTKMNVSSYSAPETFLDWLMTEGEKESSDNQDKMDTNTDNDGYDYNSPQSDISENGSKQIPDYDAFLLQQAQDLSPSPTQISTITSANNAQAKRQKDIEMAQMVENRKRGIARRKRKEDQLYNSANKRQRSDYSDTATEYSDLHNYDNVAYAYPESEAYKTLYIPTNNTDYASNDNNYSSNPVPNYFTPIATNSNYQIYTKQNYIPNIDQQYVNQQQILANYQNQPFQQQIPQASNTTSSTQTKEKEFYNQIVHQFSEKIQSDITNTSTFKQIRGNMYRMMGMPVLAHDK